MASATDGSSESGRTLDLRVVVNTIPALAWSSQSDGSFDFVNQRWCDYTGLSPEESYGQGWKTAIHPVDLATLVEKWDALADANVWQASEVRLRRSNGMFRWFSFHREPLRDENGSVTRWYGTGIDIDNAKQKEALHAAEQRTLEMVADGASLKDVLDQLCASIDVQVAPSVTTVFVMDPDGKHLLLTGGPRVPGHWISAVSPRPVTHECGLCGKAAFLKKRVIVADVATDPGWPDEYRELALSNGIRAAWSEPILTKDNEVLGTFALYSHEARIPNEDELALITGAGHIARIAIERQRSQEALRRALDEIKNSEVKLRQVIDTIPTVVSRNLPDGSKDFINKRWRDYTGLSAEESYGWGWTSAAHPEDLPLLLEGWRKCRTSGEPGEREVRVRRYDGVYRWFLIRVEPFRDETGTIIHWYGTGTDIEDRKQAEIKLRQDERELRQLIDFLPQLVVVLDKDGTLLQTNKTMLDYKGCTLEEMKGGGTRERHSRDVHPDDLERAQSERSAGLSKGAPFEVEKRLLGKDGQFRWFLFRYNPVVNESGDIVRWFATATDIEDRKQVEDRMRNEAVALREQIDRDSMFEDIVGSSEVLRGVLRQVAKVAPSDSTVLILGETGTGKELVARAIHKQSRRAERAFIGVNCAAIPPSLISSELFGHEKGAFTGATQRRPGRFESANGGTIFLDEVGDLPPEIQIALLRVLQEREIERVGSNKAIPVDVRVVAATHRDLNALVAEGEFREDLLYRLNVVPIEMPALRERVGDIPLLVEYFIDRFGKRAGKKFGTIDKKSLKLFQAYGWPGNVRELQNVIERAVILCEGETFSVDEAWLGRELRPAPTRTGTLHGALVRQEKEMIEAALSDTGGRISGPGGAANKLGLPRATLDARIRRLGINKYRFKGQRSS